MSAGSHRDEGMFRADGDGIGAGTQIAGYLVLDRIGRGGMAVVFRAEDARLGRTVALKVLAPVLADDAPFRQRFVRESRAAAAVDDPHIIPVFEAGEAQGVLFIAMRYVAGGDVRSLISRSGPLTVSRVASIVSPVASALDAAHSAGLVHRDVKPANILIDIRPGRPDHVYLSDFGLSKGALSSVGLTGSGLFLGTPDYVSPEQITGRNVDGRADQYALACAAFEILSGQPPFPRDHGMAVMYAHTSEPPPALTSRRTDLPGAVDAVFVRALAKDPADRFGSCREFGDSLREALRLAPYDTEGAASQKERSAAVVVKQVTADPTADSTAGRPATEFPPGSVPNVGKDQPLTAGTATDGETITAVRRDARYSARSAGALVPVPPDVPGRLWVPVPGPKKKRPSPSLLLIAAVLMLLAGILVYVNIPPGFLSGRATSGFVPGRPVSIADPTGNGISSVAFDPNGSALAAGDTVGTTYLWKAPTWTEISSLRDPSSGGIASIAFSSNGMLLAAGDGSGTTYLWNAASGTRLGSATEPQCAGCTVGSMALSRQGTTVAAADPNCFGTIYLSLMPAGSFIRSLNDPSQFDDCLNFNAVAFSPNGRLLAAGDTIGHVDLWNTAGWAHLKSLSAPSGDGINTIGFSPDNHFLAAGDTFGDIYLWSTAQWTQITSLYDPSGGSVNTVAFSPDSHFLAVGDTLGHIYLWSTAGWTRIASLSDPSSSNITSIAISPNGRFLAAGDGNGRVYVWDISRL